MLYPLEEIFIFLHEGLQLFDPVLEPLAIRGESGGRHESRCQPPPLTPNRPPIQIPSLLAADETTDAVDLRKNTNQGRLEPLFFIDILKKRIE